MVLPHSCIDGEIFDGNVEAFRQVKPRQGSVVVCGGAGSCGALHSQCGVAAKRAREDDDDNEVLCEGAAAIAECALPSGELGAAIGQHTVAVSGVWGVGSGEWGMESGEWRVGSEEWRVESGEWSLESGERSVETGEWRVEIGVWRVESGEWRVEREAFSLSFSLSLSL